MSVFNQIVKSMMVDDVQKKPVSKISTEEYAQWKQEFTFAALTGQRYGQNFCNQFGVTDNILYYTMTTADSDIYIKANYVA